MTRRQERMARIVKEAVSDAITNHLNDPRIGGFISVTRVDMSADLRSADVYLSIFSKAPVLEPDSQKSGAEPSDDDAAQNKSFIAITHAKNRIQALLADKLESKFCPVLRFYRDKKFKKTLETIKLIEQASSELKKKDSVEQEENGL